jgi:putative ABC transport system ATP-binding protein
MTEVVVSGKDVWKIFGSGDTEVAALRGVDIEITRKEMLAIMGPSGCGKTTFLNCFSGLDEATRGEIRLEGVELNSMNDDAKSRYRALRTGFVFQRSSGRTNRPAISMRRDLGV